MALILFEDIFDVKDIDPDGKKFERGLCSIYLMLVIVLLCACIILSGTCDMAVGTSY